MKYRLRQFLQVIKKRYRDGYRQSLRSDKVNDLHHHGTMQIVGFYSSLCRGQRNELICFRLRRSRIDVIKITGSFIVYVTH